MSEKDNSYQCIECGREASERYHEYKNKKVIKIRHCGECNRTVDKYIEYDTVLVYLDAMLLKIPAYRHILINEKHSVWSVVKLTLGLLLCDAFTKLMLKKSDYLKKKVDPDRVFFAAFEVNLYWNYFLAVIQWCIHIAIVIFLIKFSNRKKEISTIRKDLVMKAIIMSNCGKVLVIPAILWGQAHGVMYLGLSQLFVLVSNIQALRVISGMKLGVLLVIVGMATLCHNMAVHVLPESIDQLI